MKKSMSQWLFLFVLGLLAQNAQSQDVFSEGFIIYNVFNTDSTKPCGTYTQTIKSGNIRRELKLHNGLHQVTIHQAHTGDNYSLYTENDHLFALLLSKTEYDSLQNARGALTRNTTGQHKKILGYDCQGVEVLENKSRLVDGFFTNKITTQHEYFNPLFPNLPGIALEYTTHQNNNDNLTFIAVEITESVIDPRIFTIPIEYQIIRLNDLAQ
ncbi:MAG: hypothetical protein FGM54_05440 [Chitinophagaceae bacterium]|nr:hypothetical protein [Chitinophagaceae bacterium]